MARSSGCQTWPSPVGARQGPVQWVPDMAQSSGCQTRPSPVDARHGPVQWVPDATQSSGCQTWPSPVGAHEKLWGPAEAMLQTADFILLYRTENLAWTGAQKK